MPKYEKKLKKEMEESEHVRASVREMKIELRVEKVNISLVKHSV